MKLKLYIVTVKDNFSGEVFTQAFNRDVWTYGRIMKLVRDSNCSLVSIVKRGKRIPNSF